tara:strand:- start:4 stop:366 length:363 start_codon:yes stop_codon:yes gene_type:complete
MKTKQDNLLDLLDIVILLQMLIEKVEDFQINNHYNKQLIKQQVKALLKTITPLAERDYNIVFNNEENETQQIISEYESLVSQIRDFNVPQKVILTQMITAFNHEPKTIEATVHRIIKKYT